MSIATKVACYYGCQHLILPTSWAANHFEPSHPLRILTPYLNLTAYFITFHTSLYHYLATVFKIIQNWEHTGNTAATHLLCHNDLIKLAAYTDYTLIEPVVLIIFYLFLLIIV